MPCAFAGALNVMLTSMTSFVGLPMNVSGPGQPAAALGSPFGTLAAATDARGVLFEHAVARIALGAERVAGIVELARVARADDAEALAFLRSDAAAEARDGCCVGPSPGLQLAPKPFVYFALTRPQWPVSAILANAERLHEGRRVAIRGQAVVARCRIVDRAVGVVVAAVTGDVEVPRVPVRTGRSHPPSPLAPNAPASFRCRCRHRSVPSGPPNPLPFDRLQATTTIRETDTPSARDFMRRRICEIRAPRKDYYDPQTPIFPGNFATTEKLSRHCLKSGDGWPPRPNPS